MWVSHVQSFTDLGGGQSHKDVKLPPPVKLADWGNRQITKAKMFDNLIANIDPNQGQLAGSIRRGTSS